MDGAQNGHSKKVSNKLVAWGHSQTTFAAMGEGGVHEMSALQNKFSIFY